MIIRKEEIRKNFEAVKEKIKGVKSPLLLAVSKTYPVSDILLAYELGQRDFGENRVGELVEKANLIAAMGIKDVVWHFIGNLQSNKIKKLMTVPGLGFIHSVESLELLQKLLSYKEMKIGLYLQVKTSDENEKQGFESREEILEAVRLFGHGHNHCQGPVLVGLMTMGKWRVNNPEQFEEEARACFRKLFEMREFLNLPLLLSMGMSNDFKLAMEFDTDVIRLGTQLFGRRDS